MNRELEEQLIEEFPQLFKDAYCSPQASCMAFCCDVGDGWRDIIHQLCKDIMATNPPKEVCFAQIKEKYGVLTVYLSSYTDEIDRAIEKAGKASSEVCENCGEPAKLDTSRSWWITLCQKCKDARYKV
jgi:hypothetical protein